MDRTSHFLKGLRGRVSKLTFLIVVVASIGVGIWLRFSDFRLPLPPGFPPLLLGVVPFILYGIVALLKKTRIGGFLEGVFAFGVLIAILIFLAASITDFLHDSWVGSSWSRFAISVGIGVLVALPLGYYLGYRSGKYYAGEAFRWKLKRHGLERLWTLDDD